MLVLSSIQGRGGQRDRLSHVRNPGVVFDKVAKPGCLLCRER